VSRVICAGHVNWDVTLYVDGLPGPDGEAVIDRQVQAGGGSASNTAAVLGGLGIDVAVLGSVGDDDHGGLARRELAEAGVDCRHVRTVPDEPTTVKYLVVDATGQVMVLANEGVNEAYRPADLEQSTLAAADHLHLTGQDPETATRLVDRATEAGVTVSIDPGRRVGDRDFTPAVRHASYLFVNDREAETASQAGLVDATEGVVVLKHGDSGGTVLTGDGPVDHPGFSVEAVDTAGAGDAFAGGFLAARLDGRGFERALSVANACGALAARCPGAQLSLSWDDVEGIRSGEPTR